MGISDKDAELQAAKRNPQPAPTTKPNVVESATIGNERLLRGIPVAGIGGGAITGTRPGDQAHELIRANAELHASMMRRAREQLNPT